MNTHLSSSMEDYLETIYQILNREGKVRVTDISEALDVKKPSVNAAIRKLKNLNLVTHEKYDDIYLTEKGTQEAKRIQAKHDILLRFLSDFLVIPKDLAVKDACKIEHAISNITFERLTKFIEFVDDSPFFNKDNWQKLFGRYIAEKKPDPVDS